MRDRNLAFQAAETALKAGEADVLTAAYNCTNGRFMAFDKDCNAATVETVPVWESISWSASANPLQSIPLSGGTMLGLAANPRYIIEYLGPAGTKFNFRVTARATGGTTSAVVMVQSIYQTTTAPP